MTTKRPDDENIHVSARAKAYLQKRAFKESTATKRKFMRDVVDDLCFPKGLKVKVLSGV